MTLRVAWSYSQDKVYIRKEFDPNTQLPSACFSRCVLPPTSEYGADRCSENIYPACFVFISATKLSEWVDLANPIVFPPRRP